MIGEKVRVYRNLNKKRLSVLKGGKVRVRPHCVVLTDVTFTVRPSGWAKVIHSQRKNVHAFVNGTLVHYEDGLYKFEQRCKAAERTNSRYGFVTYNPYHGPYFVTNHEQVISAPEVWVLSTGRIAVFGDFTTAPLNFSNGYEGLKYRIHNPYTNALEKAGSK